MILIVYEKIKGGRNNAMPMKAELGFSRILYQKTTKNIPSLQRGNKLSILLTFEKNTKISCFMAFSMCRGRVVRQPNFSGQVRV